MRSESWFFWCCLFLLNRNCIGMNFAMAEMKVAVAMILKRYVLLNLFCPPWGPGHSHIKRTDCLSKILKRALRATKILFCGRGLNFFSLLRGSNRPFPSSLVPLFQNEFNCEILCLCFKTSSIAKPFKWKWILHAVSFSCKSKSFS